MKALTYHGPKDIRFESVADATPRDARGAVVRTTAVGICGSDLHIYHGQGFSEDLGFTVGHEAVGEVVEVGSEVQRFRVGDRVLVPASTGCTTCEPCRHGFVLRCENGSTSCYGLAHALEGSQAEAVAVPDADTGLWKIPDEVSDDQALLLTDNLPTAWYGARRAAIEPGQSVAVVGLGPVGLCAVLSAQAMGAARVFGIDRVPERRAAAQDLGAIAIESDDPQTAILEATRGQGCDAVVEAVGADATIALAQRIVRREGNVSIVGVSRNAHHDFNFVYAQFQCLSMHIGLCSVQRELAELVPLVASGRLSPERIVTDRVPLSEGAEAYRRFDAREAGALKFVLQPSQ